MINHAACRISFEFFPPKSTEAMEKLMDAAKRLGNFSPSFFSVTFGAGGSTRQRTLETLVTLREHAGIAMAPHISCLGYARSELASLLNQYLELGVTRLVVLRGDLPPGEVKQGDIEFACDFVRFIREMTNDHFQIEVAAYPEFHPQAENATQDILNLKKKYEAGANTAITQYFFNTDAFFYYRDACEAQQIHMPIVPGMMPILNVDRLVRFSHTCGAEIPQWLMKRLQAYGDDAESVRQFGIEVLTNMCERLLKGGVPGLHFYTLNNDDVCAQVLRELGLPVSLAKVV
jgi:methylenetetrahydrofolate reductase (NADPH)